MLIKSVNKCHLLFSYGLCVPPGGLMIHLVLPFLFSNSSFTGAISQRPLKSGARLPLISMGLDWGLREEVLRDHWQACQSQAVWWGYYYRVTENSPHSSFLFLLSLFVLNIWLSCSYQEPSSNTTRDNEESCRQHIAKFSSGGLTVNKWTSYIILAELKILQSLSANPNVHTWAPSISVPLWCVHKQHG